MEYVSSFVELTASDFNSPSLFASLSLSLSVSLYLWSIARCRQRRIDLSLPPNFMFGLAVYDPPSPAVCSVYCSFSLVPSAGPGTGNATVAGPPLLDPTSPSYLENRSSIATTKSPEGDIAEGAFVLVPVGLCLRYDGRYGTVGGEGHGRSTMAPSHSSVWKTFDSGSAAIDMLARRGSMVQRNQSRGARARTSPSPMQNNPAMAAR